MLPPTYSCSTFFSFALLIFINLETFLSAETVTTSGLPKNYDEAKIPIQCGNSFNTLVSKTQGDWVSCKNYGSFGYYCPFGKCYWKDPQNSQSKTPFDKKGLSNCHRFKAAGIPSDEVIKTVYPISYMTHNLHGVMLVAGIEDFTKPKDIHAYVCRWTNENDPNNIRPWCDECVYWEYEEPSWIGIWN